MKKRRDTAGFPAVDLADIPAILFAADLARVLRTSERTIMRLRSQNALPIRELPALDRRKRYSREDVLRYLNGEQPK
jgi:hypothetical protein